MKRPQIVNLELEDIMSNEDVSNTEKYIKQLELERDQLAAQNERLRVYARSLQSQLGADPDHCLDEEDADLWLEIDSVLKQSPAASLAEIQARAIECAVQYVNNKYENIGSFNDFIEYADMIRQQAKQGGDQP